MQSAGAHEADASPPAPWSMVVCSPAGNNAARASKPATISAVFPIGDCEPFIKKILISGRKTKVLVILVSGAELKHDTCALVNTGQRGSNCLQKYEPIFSRKKMDRLQERCTSRRS